MRILMTNFVKKSEVKNGWYLIDGSNAVVGRLATIIAKILRGKHKTTFTPHMDHGDFVVVKNIENIKFSGKNLKIKNIIDTQDTLVELRLLHLKNYTVKNLVKL